MCWIRSTNNRTNQIVTCRTSWITARVYVTIHQQAEPRGSFEGRGPNNMFFRSTVSERRRIVEAFTRLIQPVLWMMILGPAPISKMTSYLSNFLPRLDHYYLQRNIIIITIGPAWLQIWLSIQRSFCWAYWQLLAENVSSSAVESVQVNCQGRPQRIQIN